MGLLTPIFKAGDRAGYIDAAGGRWILAVENSFIGFKGIFLERYCQGILTSLDEVADKVHNQRILESKLYSLLDEQNRRKFARRGY